MATAYNFDLLDLADGESGDAAVSVVVGKKKTEAAAAKVADAADPTQPAAQEKPKFSYFTKLQLDQDVSLCQRQLEKLDSTLYKLRAEEKTLKEQPGNEARLEEVCNEQQKRRLERIKLREKERPLVQKRDDFYQENGIPLPKPKLNADDPLKVCLRDLKEYNAALYFYRVEETNLKGQPGNEARLKEIYAEKHKLLEERKKLREEESRLLNQRDAELDSNHNGVNGFSNNDGGRYDDEYQTQMGDGDQYKHDHDENGDHYKHDHDERQVERGQSYYNNGDRQGYRQREPKTTKKYVRKAKASSDAGTEAEEKPEENVVSAIDAEQKEASADNADAVPASKSDKSAGGEASADNANVPASKPDKSAGGAAREGPKKGTKNTLNGSEKRKKKNAKKNSEPEKVKKQDFEVGSTDKQPLEEEKKTLAEYEKMLEEKKKTLEASKTEVRKVTAEGFKDLRVLEKKTLDDEEAIKVEKAQPKVKEASKKEEVLAEGKDAAAKDGKTKKVVPLHEIVSFRQPRRFTVQEDGSSARTRFNGGFQGGSRDNSTEPRINGRAAQNEGGVRNSNGAPRGAYNGRGDGAPRGDYSGGRGNGGYAYGRGNGGYGRGHGGKQGDGGYQQQQQGVDVGQYQRERAGNGGYQQQRQGGNVGQHQQDRAFNGGYHQQRNHPGRYYQQRGNTDDRRNFQRVPAPVLENFEDMKAFPALSAPASAAPTSAPAPVPTQASAPAAAPAPAA